MIKIRTPGSCGELIQGFYGGNEMLISYPIDIFSEVFIGEGRFKNKGIDLKSIDAIYKFFDYFKLPRNEIKNISINVKTDIPYGKGMASSTADIAGIIYGLSKYYNLNLTKEVLAKLCTSVEPTDSIIFEKISLFDHINGNIVESFDWDMDFKVMILEPSYEVNTIEFRSQKKKQLNAKNHNSKVLDKFRQAYMEKSYYKLGEAAILSAFENQEILKKDYLETIISIANRNNCYGINIAHSGSVLGIMYDESRIDYEKLIYDLKESKIFEIYNKYYNVNVVKGGPKIIKE